MRQRARTFVAALADSGMPADALDSVCIHFLACHTAAQTEEFGPLWFWSGEGLEHTNYKWKQTGCAVAQRGLARHQNGGRKPSSGQPQRRKAPGREGQTFAMVLCGEEHGGMAREGHTCRPRHARPGALL